MLDDFKDDDVLDPNQVEDELEDFEDDMEFGEDFDDFDFDDDDEEYESGSGIDKKYILFGIVAVVAILIIATVFFRSRRKPNENVLEPVEPQIVENVEEDDKPTEEELAEQARKEEAEREKQKIEELNQAIGIGVQDLSQVGTKVEKGTKNTAEVSQRSPVQDFQSTDIPIFYEIDNIRYVRDYVSYTKYRTTTAPGVELYWLDATYQGKRAIIPTSLGVFQNLTPTGVVAVDVEVTTLVPEERGQEASQVITGFYIVLDKE